MKGLGFLKPAGSHLEPFTTSDIIADCAGVQRATVSRLVRKHQKDLEEFGQVGFEIRAVRYARGTNEEKLWHFNEQQATLFITYLQNTEPVRQFKKDLVREFFAMRKELEKRKVLRAESRPGARGRPAGQRQGFSYIRGAAALRKEGSGRHGPSGRGLKV